jgi:hypothetical protein
VCKKLRGEREKVAIYLVFLASWCTLDVAGAVLVKAFEV